MIKNKKIFIFLLLFIMLIVLSFVFFKPTKKVVLKPTPTPPGATGKTHETVCKESGGTWLKDYNECEGASTIISESQCISLGGKYFECESPCRHEPETEGKVCITLCMKVCKF